MTRRFVPGGLAAMALLLAAPTAAIGAPPASIDPGGGGPPPDDTAPPAVAVDRPAGDVDGWHRGPVDLGIRVTDNHTGDLGVREVSYTMSGATTGTNRVTYTNERAVTVPIRVAAEGSTRIDIRAEDRAGHVTTRTEWVGIDTTNPSVSIDSPLDGRTVRVGERVPVAFACGDETSWITACAGSHPVGELVDTSSPGSRVLSVVATDVVGRTTMRSATLQVVADVPTVTISSEPVIVGTPRIGERLEVQHGEFTPLSSVIYRWYRNGVLIPGGAGSYYTVSAADAGATIQVVVTATASGHEPGVFTSPAVGPIPVPVPPPGGGTGGTGGTGGGTGGGGGGASGQEAVRATTTGSVSGTARIGRTLSATAPTWSVAAATTSRQWLRNGAPIPAATGTTYRLGAADRGARISVRFTGQATGRPSGTVDSAATAPVGKAAATVRARLVRGVVKVRVSAPGVVVAGKVTVRAAGQRATATLRKGRASIRLRPVSRATKVAVVYRGSALVAKATAPARR